MTSYRGVDEGLPLLLGLLGRERIPATFFTTGDVARRRPDLLRELVDQGHELACHGDTHRRFDAMNWDTAEQEICAATSELRKFYPVSSFRAPNLSFPETYVAILEKYGYRLDSSRAHYKLARWTRPIRPSSLVRAGASVTSSALRLPLWMRRLIFGGLKSPAVLFVHPWEFVDFTRSRLRLDCRFRTGPAALRCLKENLGYFRRRGDQFVRMCELSSPANRQSDTSPAM
jgi:peptidoglycan/xylan/chitin deacetylase (PgdA/CDA1 family)